MNLRVLALAAMVVLIATPMFAQPADWYFQVRYAANTGLSSVGDSWINITNTGASGGNICVNVYTFSPDEQLVSCCACPVTPNGLANLGVRRDLISNTLTPAYPSSVVVKLLSTTGGACNAATPGTPALGLAAWGTTNHDTPGVAGSFSVTETAFTPSTLSAAELTRISQLCSFLQVLGSGYGICGSCRPGAMGGAKK